MSGGGYDCVVEGVIGLGYCGGCNCLGVSGGGCDWLQVENMSVNDRLFFVCVCVFVFCLCKCFQDMTLRALLVPTSAPIPLLALCAGQTASSNSP